MRSHRKKLTESLSGLRTIPRISGSRMPLPTCLILLLASTAIVAGCQSTPQYTNVDSQPLPTREMDIHRPYTLAEGDRIQLKFLLVPDLNDEVLIGPDGKAALQLVSSVQMAGLTTEELRDQLIEAYGKHIQVPELTVSLTEVAPQRIYIGGEVKTPGMYEADGGLTLMQAIFLAGGYLPEANVQTVVVLRDNGDSVLDYYIVDVQNGLSTLDSIQNFRLQRQDIVFVPRTKVSSITQFLNQYLGGVKEVLGVFNFTATYELRDFGTN